MSAYQGQTLTMTFNTTVESLEPVAGTSGDLVFGIIPNDAVVNINGSSFTTNEPTTVWGSIEIQKHAAGDVTKTLEGAIFTVHASAADDAPAISVGGETQLETNDLGIVVIPGLYVGTTPAATATYYLREVAAPSGYNIPTGVFPLAVTIDGAQTLQVEVPIANPQKPDVELPVTGGGGTVALMFTGLGLILAAAGTALVFVRRRSGDARS